MFRFSINSLQQLHTCDPRLQLLFNVVIRHKDCTIIEGYRNQERQDMLYYENKSKVKYPNSKHNIEPSIAVDVVPYLNGVICWEANQCYFFAGYVLRLADELSIPIRWGGDWDGDGDVNDQVFHDLVHYELI